MSLSPMAPDVLATMLPVSDHEVVFQYYIMLDGSFQQKALDGAWKANIDELPAQFIRTLRKKPKHPEDPRDQGEEWTAGVNILKEGKGIVYQSFLVLGGEPRKERLGSHKYEGVGQVFSLDTISVANAPVSEAVVPAATWLQCAVKPVQVDMQLKIVNGSIAPHAINPKDMKPVVYALKHFKNRTQHPVQYSPGIICEYAESMESSVTDSHSFSTGVTLSWTNSVDFGLAESEFSVELSFNYEESRSTTASESKSKTFTVSDIVDITVQPGEEITYATSIFAAENAKADISLDFSLHGNLDGTSLSGDYLATVANAMSATDITAVGPDSITYTVKGTLNAKVATSSDIEVNRVPASAQAISAAH
jgi:Clostridium epsilon toxin ETX/Bacillus mosquitocidal toxin MTX2